jgi:hypothetical protein
MSRIIVILGLTLLSQFSFAQITTTKVADKKEEISTEPYDSLYNYLGKDVLKYIGQVLYLKGKSESLREYGYANFVKDYKYVGYDREKNTYKCCDSYNSKYDELVGKYFKVLAVHKHPKSNESEYLYGKKYYLELKEKESADIIYFEYDTQYEHSFPFIVVGFFEKQKNINVGKYFVFANKILKSSTDIETGKQITNTTAQKWECVDLTVEEKYYNLALTIKNSLSEKTTISYESVFGKYSKGRAYKLVDAKAYKKKFKLANWLKILDGKIVIGFTEEMVLLSWGKPKDINRASYGDQWIYDGQYLYFKNGKLKSFN